MKLVRILYEMEYRYRRRTARLTTKLPYFAATAVFLLVAGAIGFSKPSTWVAERLLVPVFSGRAAGESLQTDDAGTAEEGAAVDAGTASRTCVLPTYTCYALQIGAYADAENAKTQAQALIRLGAAGKIAEDGGRYRVLASGYQAQSDAKAVQQQLLAEGIESYVYAIRCAERTYTVVGDEKQSASFTAAVEGVSAILGELYAAMIAFDRESLHASEGLVAVRTVAGTCKTHLDALSALQPDAAGQVRALAGFYESVYALASDVADMEAAETAALSSRLKNLYLAASDCRAALSAP